MLVFHEIVDFFRLNALHFKNCSERQKLLEVAGTAKSYSKRQKLLKSCRAQTWQAYWPGNTNSLRSALRNGHRTVYFLLQVVNARSWVARNTSKIKLNSFSLKSYTKGGLSTKKLLTIALIHNLLFLKLFSHYLSSQGGEVLEESHGFQIEQRKDQ